MSDQTQERRPAGNWTANQTDTTTASSVPPEGMDGETWISLFTRRVLADALCEASARYWERRAATFEDAAPRPGEFHGRASREELSAAWQRCHRDADRCRRHAELLRDRSVSAARDDWSDLVAGEVAA